MKTTKLLLVAAVALALIETSVFGQARVTVAPSGVASTPSAPKPPKVSSPVLELHGDEIRLLESASDAVREVTGDIFISRSGSAKTTRTLVIPAGQVDATQHAQMEEDLLVMWRILDKALRRSGEDGDKKSAMGIELSTFGSSSSPYRNLYLEGHGALFLLRAKFPLIPPPDKVEEPVKKEPTNSEWEEARRDIYGNQTPFEAEFSRALKGFSRSRAVDYDEGKAESLKSALIDSLKNGAYIRHLKPQETITIIVLGTEVRTPHDKSAALGETTLLLRVKKSDMEDFNKDKTSSDDFRKKVQVLTYFRRSLPGESGESTRVR